MSKFVNAEEVAELLNLEVSTVWKWARQQAIPCYKIRGHYYFVMEEVWESLSRNKIKARK